MPSHDNNLYDVLIAGAGPVGLFLACELRLAGCSVLVLEKAPAPYSPLKDLPFGLRGLSVATCESLDRRGLLTDLQTIAVSRDTPAAAHWMQQPRHAAGHFAGIQFFHDQIDQAQWRYRLPGPISTIAADMAHIEAVLAARADLLGVEIRRDCGVEAFEASGDGVIVQAGGWVFVGRWLVGCDGGRSMVRKMAGIGFTGTDPEFTGYSVLADLVDPEVLKPGRHYTPAGMYTYAAPDTVAMVDFDGGAFHREELTRDHVEAVMRKVTGSDVRITALRLAATWTDRAFQAADYRKGRILLAGDAAHVHSPLGGQGLNLGLGDAMNLGWKLASMVRGDAPEDLLDSYALERMPVGAQILDWSRAQVALMRPSASARALEAIVRDLTQTGNGASYFAERIWGIGLRYDLGDSHRLVGRSCPDFEFTDGSKLNEHLRGGRGLLLDFGMSPESSAVAEGWPHRIDYIATDAIETLGLSALLMRPDGIVAWASEGLADTGSAVDCATRWFGRAF